jgi:UDP-N-acetyl-D-glucosamine dehydrogenase
MRRWGDLGKRSVTLSAEALRGYDCVLVATHHSAYDWQMVADNAQLVVDTRGAMRKVKGKRDHIVTA